MTKVFLTGATGVMGMAGLRHLVKARYGDGAPHITVLARDTKKNRRKLEPFIKEGVEVIWGDLMDPSAVAQGVDGADVVLHVGGMVSPAADWYPEKTYEVNTGAMRNIVDAAIAKEKRGGRVRVVYIGSVSQYGNRPEGVHWGRTGDPINVATFDKYALSKSEAELMLSESGLKEWVSLRQTGIFYPSIIMKGSDPISFHVPLRGCLEWVSDDDSGRLLTAVADPSLPKTFWRRFYNIGGGASWRESNYDFVNMTLTALGCPPIEKSFKRNWFATRNFHGIWFTDSDLLDSMLHFRGGESMERYIERIKRGLPPYFRLAPLAPSKLIRAVMKQVASRKTLGPLDWLANDNEERIFAAWGGREAYDSIPGWDEEIRLPLSGQPKNLDHGYDESKTEEEWTASDLQAAAEFRGGRLVSELSGLVDPDIPVEWECAEGHRFRLTPRSVLLGGHWCLDCLREISGDAHALFRQAARNPFLRQITEAYDDKNR